MKWSKSPPELIETFDAALPGPPIERKLMFGYPAGFVNGNMFCGLWQDSLILRLDEKSRTKLKGAKPFEPMPGRPMKEYVVAPRSIVDDSEALAKWMETAVSFVSKLPPKKKKAAPKKKKAKK